MSISLDFIRSVEEKAQEIDRSYQEAIEQSRERVDVLLEEKAIEYEKDASKELNELEEKLKHKKAVVQKELDETIENSRTYSQNALSENKTELVDWIIERVVSEYGN